MNTPSPDQQTDAGKTAFDAYYLQPNWRYEDENDISKERWNKAAVAVLAKHIPQVTEEDVFFNDNPNVQPDYWNTLGGAAKASWQKKADRINTRLRSRLVPEVAAVGEWEEFEPFTTVYLKDDFVRSAYREPCPDEKKWLRLFDACIDFGKRNNLQVRRRKKQAESPTQDERATDHASQSKSNKRDMGSPALESPHQPSQVAGDGATPDNPEGEITLPMKEYDALREQVEGLEKTCDKSLTEMEGWKAKSNELQSQLTTALKEWDEALTVAGRHLTINQNLVAANEAKDAEIVRLKEEWNALGKGFGLPSDISPNQIAIHAEFLHKERTKLLYEATLRTAPAKGLTARQIQEVAGLTGSILSARSLATWERELNALLSTQPVSPWISLTERKPTEKDADRNGKVLALFADTDIRQGDWNFHQLHEDGWISKPVAWRTTDLPLPVVVEDDKDVTASRDRLAEQLGRVSHQRDEAWKSLDAIKELIIKGEYSDERGIELINEGLK